MSDSRRNIKLPPEDFQALKEEKPQGVSWGYYLTEIRTVNGDE